MKGISKDRAIVLTHFIFPYTAISIILIIIASFAHYNLEGPPPIEKSIMSFLSVVATGCVVWIVCRNTLGRLPALIRVGEDSQEVFLSAVLITVTACFSMIMLHGQFARIEPLTTESWKERGNAIEYFSLGGNPIFGHNSVELGYIDTAGKANSTYLFFYSGVELSRIDEDQLSIFIYSTDRYLLPRNSTSKDEIFVSQLASLRERSNLDKFQSAGGFIRPLRDWEFSKISQGSSIEEEELRCCYDGAVIVADPRKLEWFQVGGIIWFLFLTLVVPIAALFKRPNPKVLANLAEIDSYFERLFFSKYRLLKHSGS